MEKDRLAAFSDGVIAILITIMVLELKVPHGDDLHALSTVAPTFLSYMLSFVYVAIYWNNHHHMLFTVKTVNGNILWANMNLLFWLSVIPFTTAWAGENYLSKLPTAIYGVALLLAAAAYFLLQSVIVSAQGKESLLARAIGKDIKGKVSPPLYLAGVVLSFIHPWIADLIYVFVAAMWCIPDRRVERLVKK